MDNNKAINQYKDIEGLRIQFKGIEGIIGQVNIKKETYYADNIKYHEEVFYEIEILTDDMYTIKIYPIAEGTLKELYKSKKIIEEYNLNTGLKID